MRIEATPEQLRRAYEATAGDPAWSASRRLMDEGRPPSEMFRTLAVRPDLLAALSALGPAVYPGGLLERSLKERVIVETSRFNRCQYCAGSHTGTMRRQSLGDPDAPADTLPDRDQAALAYARAAIADANAVPDPLFERLKSLFTSEEIVELTFLVGLTCLLNLFNSALQVEYHGDYEVLAGAPVQ